MARKPKAPPMRCDKCGEPARVLLVVAVCHDCTAGFAKFNPKALLAAPVKRRKPRKGKKE